MQITLSLLLFILSFFFPDQINSQQTLLEFRVFMVLILLHSVYALYLTGKNVNWAMIIFIYGVPIIFTLKHIFIDSKNAMTYANTFLGMTIPLVLALVYFNKKMLLLFIKFNIICHIVILGFSEVSLFELYNHILTSFFLHLMVCSMSSGKRKLESETCSEISIRSRINQMNFLSRRLAHEINTPLSVLLLSSEDLPKDCSLRAQKSINKIKDIVDIFTSYDTQNIRPKIKPLEIYRLVKTAEIVATDHSLPLDNDINDKDNSIVLICLEDVKQIICELVKNAINHAGKEIKLSITLKRPHLILTVSDAGEGLPLEVIRNLGSPFNSNDDYFRSMGTGLSLVCFNAFRNNINLNYERKKNKSIFSLTFNLS